MSCNTAYANVGLALGGDALHAEAQAFGFGADIDNFPLNVAQSVFPAVNVPQTAQAAIGQYDVAATPCKWLSSPRRSRTAASK